jgi:hypothetical protein
MTEQSRSGLQAELDVLRQRLGDLEAKQRESARRPSRSRRRVFSRKFLFGAFPVALLLAAGGLLYGAAALDPLFIDKDGNASFSGKVGIGKTGPSEKLEVSGGKIQLDGNQQIKFTESDTSNNLKLQLWGGHGLGINAFTLFYAANGRHSWRDANGTNERMALTTGADGGLTVTGTGNSSFAGNVGIGASPGAKLDVAGTVRLGQGIAESWFPYSDNNAYISGNQTIIRSDTSGKHKEFVRIDQNGNVGIGTTSPLAKLDIQGGADSNGGSDPQALAFSYRNGGYRHWLRTRHNSTVGSGNAIDFFVNNSSAADGSKGPGTGSVHVMTLDSGNVGIGTTEPGAYKLNVNGKTKITGTLEVSDLILNGKTLRMVAAGGLGNNGQWNNGNTGFAVLDSDIRLKTDIHPVPTALEKVRKLRGVTYHWNQKALDYFTSDIEKIVSADPEGKEGNRELEQRERDKRYKELSRTNVGVIAQDVESVLPEAVSTDEKGYKSVRYHYLIPLLIEAVKEQDKAFQELAQTVARQRAEIERLTVAQQTVQHQSTQRASSEPRVNHPQPINSKFKENQNGGH